MYVDTIQQTRQWPFRHLLFSRFDEGIQSTPETIGFIKLEATNIEIAKALKGDRHLDAFTGSGGYAIAAAQYHYSITANDSDVWSMLRAQNNAAVYGVAKRIRFTLMDAARIIAHDEFDALFMDPPWGDFGLGEKGRYEARRTDMKFKWKNFPSYIQAILSAAFSSNKNIALMVPSIIDLEDMEKQSGKKPSQIVESIFLSRTIALGLIYNR